MATRTIQITDDDLDPTQEATGTIRFGLESVWYEVDLTDAHQEDFHKALKKYVEVARRVGGKQTSTKKSTSKKSAATNGEPVAGLGPNGSNETGHSNREIRDWARSAGIEVPPRGRIPSEVIAQFAAQHETPAPEAEAS